MYDHNLFLDTLSQFARRLLLPYEIDAVLSDLAARLTQLLDLAGSGVTLARDGRLQMVTAVPSAVVGLEQIQQRLQAGPCVAAYRTGRVIAFTDLSREANKWPDYCRKAEELGMTAVAGIPMRLHTKNVGALNMYARTGRTWPEEDLAAAGVMADIATGYLINASKYHQQEQLSQQLQHALSTRVVVEQAKGVLASVHDISVDEAFERIRAHARTHNVTVAAVSEAIVRVGLRI